MNGTNKYHARRVEVDGKVFDSRKEAVRYQELRLMERAGLIRNLRMQFPFILIPEQKDESGKVLERAVKYKADFMYLTRDGKIVVEDVKSKATKTREYIIKRKLMLKVHGIQIREV